MLCSELATALAGLGCCTSCEGSTRGGKQQQREGRGAGRTGLLHCFVGGVRGVERSNIERDGGGGPAHAADLVLQGTGGFHFALSCSCLSVRENKGGSCLGSSSGLVMVHQKPEAVAFRLTPLHRVLLVLPQPPPPPPPPGPLSPFSTPPSSLTCLPRQETAC